MPLATIKLLGHFTIAECMRENLVTVHRQTDYRGITFVRGLGGFVDEAIGHSVIMIPDMQIDMTTAIIKRGQRMRAQNGV